MVTVRSGLREVPSAAPLGRDWELGQMLERARAAAGGAGQAVLLRGAPGIGKTRLLAAVLGELRAQTTTLLAVSCAEGSTAAFSAVRALFEPLGLTADLLSGSARLAVPALRHGADAGPPPSDPYSVMHGLHWLTADLAADGPVVLAVDDVQWGDPPTLQWLGFLLRRVRDLPVLLLMAQRTGDDAIVPEAIGEIGATANCYTVDLAPLGTDAVAGMLTSGFGRPPESGFLDRYVELSGGNPFLVERILGRLRGRAAPDAGHLPMLEELGREAVARSLLDTLPASGLDVAKAVAVVGGQDLDTVTTLAGARPGHVATAVRTLRDFDLLQADRLEYSHDLIRAAVLDTMQDGELSRLRERAAWLLNHAGRPAEVVAALILQLDGEPEPWMIGVLREAAAGAERRGGPAAAARYLERALRSGDGDIGLLVDLARARFHASRSGAIELLERALARIPDPRRRIPIVTMYVFMSLAARNSPRAFEIVHETLEGLEDGPGLHPSDAALRMQAESLLLVSGLDERSTVAVVGARFRDRKPPPGDTAEERQLLGGMLALHTLEGRSGADVAAGAESVLLTGDRASNRWAVMSAVLGLHAADRGAEALGALDRIVERAGHGGELWTYVVAMATRSVVREFCGDLGEALADAQTAYDAMAQENWGPDVTLPQVALAGALVRTGDVGRAVEVLDSVAASHVDRFTLEHHWFMMARARASVAQGRPEEALACLLRCGASLSEAGIGNPVIAPWWFDAAELFAELDRRGEGLAITESVDAAARRWGTVRGIGMVRAARGVLTPGDAGIDLLAEAADLLGGSPARLELATTEYLLGRRLLRRGDTGGARERLRRSIDLSVPRRYQYLLARSVPALVGAGGRMRSGTASPVDALSGSERRVAELAADGCTNRQIAQALFLTQRTVELHLTSIFRKLGIAGRTEIGRILCFGARV